MNPFANFLTGLSRLIGSAKVHTAATGAATAAVAAYYGAQSLPAGPNQGEQKAWLYIAAFAAGSYLFKACIDGWTAEDVANATVPTAPTPTINVATGSNATAGESSPTGSSVPVVNSPASASSGSTNPYVS